MLFGYFFANFFQKNGPDSFLSRMPRPPRDGCFPQRMKIDQRRNTESICSEMRLMDKIKQRFLKNLQNIYQK